MTAPAGTEGAPVEGAPSTITPEAQPSAEQLGEPGLKALQTERDARKAAEDKVKQFEKQAEEAARAKLGDTERLTLERDEHKTAAEKAISEANRLRVALSKGIPADLIDRLAGTTVEELEADADKLLGYLKSLVPGEQTPSGPGGGKPFEFLPRGGGDPSTPPLPSDPSKLADLIPRGYHGR